MATKRILLVSDWHCGHRCGLTPPEWQVTAPKGAPRHLIKLAEARRILWAWFCKRINACRPYSALVIVGDSIDGRGERSGGTELITVDRQEQVAMCEAVFKHIGCERAWHVAGTPYHAGEQESWERVFAAAVKAKYEMEAHLNVDGLHVVAKHFIGNTASPASRFTGLSNAQVKQLLWSIRGQQPRAHVIVRAHIHRCQEVADPASNFRALTLPGLQGLGTRFGTLQTDGLPVDFGFAVLEVEDGPDSWGLHYEIAPLQMQACAVDEVK